ncbi:MAG: tol-pal system protein YbgF [Methyloceanibacter sp.]
MACLTSEWCERSRLAWALTALLTLSLPSAPGLAQQGDATSARVGRLEAEIAELKATVGTLESMMRSQTGMVRQPDAATGPVPSFAAPGALEPRVAALETQIGALTQQIEHLGRQMAALDARLAGAPLAAPSPSTAAEPPEDDGNRWFWGRDEEPAAPPAQSGDGAQPRWYGPGPAGDPAAQIPPDDNAPRNIVPQNFSTGGVPGAEPPETIMAAVPPADARSLYDQGYADYLRRDYASAETSFRDLVARHPEDPLAGSAQYWLGASYYDRGLYKEAADALLKGYKSYGSGVKAPDTLLKLGMSLAALGQKEAACSTFGELTKKFPNASDGVRSQAKGTSEKAGC